MLAVLMFTLAWWACAVEVTVVLKVALGGASHDGSGPLLYYPFPFALTLFSNIGTAIMTGCMAALCAYWQPQDGHASPAYKYMPRMLAKQPLLESCSAFLEAVPRRSGLADNSGMELEQHLGAGDRDAADLQRPASSSTPSFASMFAMGILQGLSIAAKNEALLLLSVSSRTMVFNMGIFVVLISARAFGFETLNAWKLVAAVALALGGALQQWPRPGRHTGGDWPPRGDDPLGYLAAAIGLLLDAAKLVLLQHAFTQVSQETPSMVESDSGTADFGHADEVPDGRAKTTTERQPCRSKSGASGPSKLRMVSWVMWSSTPVCLALTLAFERKAFAAAMEDVLPLLKLVTLISLGVLGINVAEFGVVQFTSAVTFNVIAQLHSIPLLLSGVLFFGERINAFEFCGFTLVVFGGVLYAWIKAREKNDFAGGHHDKLTAVAAEEPATAP